MASRSRSLRLVLAPALAFILLTGAPSPKGALADEEPTPTAPLMAPPPPEGAPAPVTPEPPQPTPTATPTTGSEAPPTEEAAPAPAPTEAAPPAPSQGSSAEIPPPVDIAGGTPKEERAGHPHVLAYQLIKPPFGVEISGSLEALGKSPGIPQIGMANARALRIELEYQPPILQRFGVIGIGPSLSVYPLSPRGDLARSEFSLWSVGGQLIYQARFLHEQILVPVAGYSFEELTYHLTRSNGRLSVSGPLFGVFLLLNPFEPSVAGDAYVDSGITRTYVVAELRVRNGSDANLSFSGSSLFLGLRFEF